MKKSLVLTAYLLPLFLSCAASAEDGQSAVIPIGQDSAVLPAGKTITIDPGKLSGGAMPNPLDTDTSLHSGDRLSLEEQQEEIKRHKQNSEEYNKAILKNWTKEFSRNESSFSGIYSHLSGNKAVIFRLIDALTPADKPEERNHAAARGVEFYARMTAYEYKVKLSDLSMINAHTYKMPAEINGRKFMIFVSKMEGDPYYLRIFAIGDKVSYEDISLLTTDFFETESQSEKSQAAAWQK